MAKQQCDQRLIHTWEHKHTNRTVEVHIPQAAGEQQAHFHVGLVSIPDAHPVVCHHGAHCMVPRIIPLLFAQLQHLLQLLPQVPVSLCHQRQLTKLTNCGETKIHCQLTEVVNCRNT